MGMGVIVLKSEYWLTQGLDDKQTYDVYINYEYFIYYL